MPPAKRSLPFKQRPFLYFSAALIVVFALIAFVSLYIGVSISFFILAGMFGIVFLCVAILWTLESTSHDFRHSMDVFHGEHENATRAYIISFFVLIGLIVLSFYAGTLQATAGVYSVEFAGVLSFAPIAFFLVGAVLLRQNLGRTYYTDIYLRVTPEENVGSTNVAWPAPGGIYYPTDWWSVGMTSILFAVTIYIVFKSISLLQSEGTGAMVVLNIVQTLAVVIIAYLIFEPLHRRVREYEQLSPQLNAKELKPYIAAGRIRVPKIAGVGQSCTISAEVTAAADITNRQAPMFEVELRAASATIEGDKNVCIPLDTLNAGKARYRWNCQFSNSGDQVMDIILRLSESSNPPQVFEYPIEHVLRVKSLASQFWPPLATLLLGVISTILELQQAGLIHLPKL